MPNSFMLIKLINIFVKPVADLRGALGTRPPSPGAKILSISCSFWEILAKSYVGAPPGKLAPPPRGNPGSATGNYSKNLICNRFKIGCGVEFSLHFNSKID